MTDRFLPLLLLLFTVLCFVSTETCSEYKILENRNETVVFSSNTSEDGQYCDWTVENLAHPQLSIRLTYEKTDFVGAMTIQPTDDRQVVYYDMVPNSTTILRASSATIKFQLAQASGGVIINAELVPTPPSPQCGKAITISTENTSLTLESPYFPFNFPFGIDRFSKCTWTIRNTLPNNTALLIYAGNTPSFQLENIEITIQSRNQKLVHILPNQNYTIPSEEATIGFANHAYQQGPGFQLIVRSTHKPVVCPKGTFRCRSQTQCVANEYFCDGGPDCNDGSDEENELCQVRSICGRFKTMSINNFTASSERIVNGSVATAGTFPWVVSLHDRQQQLQFCGGSLIAPSWLLTAAHCATNYVGQPVDVARKWIARAGSHLLYRQELPWQFDERTQRATVHPSYKSTYFIRRGHDIALVKLDRPVPFFLNSRIGFICLPEPDRHDDDNSHMMTLTGWGLTGGTGDKNVLRVTQLPLVEPKVCNNTEHYNGTIWNPHTQFCIGFEQGGSGQCTGDSGSPVVMNSNTSALGGKWTQTGVVSWSGKPCGVPKKPGVVANVTSMLDFVYTTVLSQ